MKNIKFSDIFRFDNIEEYKLHAGIIANGKQPLNEWVENKKSWEGGGQKHKGNNRWGSSKFILSMMRFHPDGNDNIWLFGGIFEILGKTKESYEVKKVKEYSEYEGRLKIYVECKGPQKYFNLKTKYDSMVVKEILSEPYSGVKFPGYENIDYHFSLLKPIFDKGRQDWKSPLENIKGVYMITDISNGKKYVGAAWGKDGVWARWAKHIYSSYYGDGEAKVLRQVIKQRGKEYAYKNFRMCLLEYYPMKKDDGIVLGREGFWKDLLLSRNPKYGYNKN